MSEWASDLLRRHQVDLGARSFASATILIEEGEGWLAARDLVMQGLRGDWLTPDDLRTSLEFARAGAFSKSSEPIAREIERRLRQTAA